MKQTISYQKARSLVSALGWAKVQAGYEWPVGGASSRMWMAFNGVSYYLIER